MNAKLPAIPELEKPNVMFCYETVAALAMTESKKSTLNSSVLNGVHVRDVLVGASSFIVNRFIYIFNH
ncbi:hypothetical protein AM10699_42390 [Acaryochloris marina MBIC10699]|nr:hypothetical protein AM10699_42390 [Acaryochloris marina MBIC10699]